MLRDALGFFGVLILAMLVIIAFVVSPLICIGRALDFRDCDAICVTRSAHAVSAGEFGCFCSDGFHVPARRSITVER